MEFYSPKQASSMLSIPASTLRRYAVEFADLLSDYANQSRRSYTGQDLNTIAMIRDLFNTGKTVEEIKSMVAEMVMDDQFMPHAVDLGDESTRVDRPEPSRAIQPIDFFTSRIDELKAEHDKTLEAKDQYIAELKQDKERLQAELDRLRSPWWRRWFD